jgi:RHS repeat-associated protein
VIDQRWIEGSGGSATDIDRYTYQFDRNSNRTARLNQLDAAFSETYAFDGVDRLVDFARSGGGTGPQDQQWNLDALGNWTTITSDGTPESRTHNSQNELTGVGASSLAYDANGNMIQDEVGRQLQYNAWNRLVRVSLSGDQVAAYQYDGFQHRIVTSVGNGPGAIARDLFYSAGWQVFEQRIRAGGSLGNVAEEQFVWSVAYIDGLILRDRNADLNNATGAGGLEQRVYALQDALWNTTALVDVNGNVLDRFAYTPYGVVETFDSNWTPTASPSIPWAVLFRGYFADEGTGLLHARNRQYSPTLGRFIGRDPLKYVDGYSLYGAYFVPTTVDPFGWQRFDFVSPWKLISEGVFDDDDEERDGWFVAQSRTVKGHEWIWDETKCCCQHTNVTSVISLRMDRYIQRAHDIYARTRVRFDVTASPDAEAQFLSWLAWGLSTYGIGDTFVPGFEMPFEDATDFASWWISTGLQFGLVGGQNITMSNFSSEIETQRRNRSDLDRVRYGDAYLSDWEGSSWVKGLCVKMYKGECEAKGAAAKQKLEEDEAAAKRGLWDWFKEGHR